LNIAFVKSFIPLPSFARNTEVGIQSLYGHMQFTDIRTLGFDQPNFAIEYEDTAVVTCFGQVCKKFKQECLRTIVPMHDWHADIDEYIV
jgi:hypothetical protein